MLDGTGCCIWAIVRPATVSERRYCRLTHLPWRVERPLHLLAEWTKHGQLGAPQAWGLGPGRIGTSAVVQSMYSTAPADWAS